MNRRLAMSLVLSGVFVLCAEMARAQQAPPPEGRMPGGLPEEMLGGPMGTRVELLGFEGMHGGKVVTGMPFSAVAVSETTQSFADGNHISRKTETNLFRDSKGRFRKDVTLPAIGPLAASGQSRSFVVISDPVANENFILHADTKTAEKMAKHFGGMKGAMKEALKEKFASRMQEEIANGNLKKEDLGTQTIAGVSAQGTRITRTIPAGQIGNEKPITIVHERWYSDELQLVVRSKRSNPWSGETTYSLTNIQRTEPDAALFTVPSDFTVKEIQPGKRGMGKFRHGPPPSPSDN